MILAPFNLLYRLSPKLELELMFFLKQGYRLNLRDPKSFNEKIQWIKLYDHNPLMPKCCDKFTVREFVEDQGCGEILNDLIWEGFNPEDIPFDSLPEKYVIKVTYGSSFNIIQNGTAEIIRGGVVKHCKKWLKAKYLPCYGEWFYGIEKPRIIVEKFIESADDEQLRDYKVFCFNGEPRLIRVDTDRFTEHKMDFFNCNWERVTNAGMGYPVSGRALERPECLTELLEYARKLSQPFIHARVDFYIVREKIYFGEITFTNGAGFDRFRPREFDYELGACMKLPAK